MGSIFKLVLKLRDLCFFQHLFTYPPYLATNAVLTVFFLLALPNY